MDILMAAIAFSEALRDTLAKQNPGTTIEKTVERLIPDARKMSPKSTESDLGKFVVAQVIAATQAEKAPDIKHGDLYVTWQMMRRSGHPEYFERFLRVAGMDKDAIKLTIDSFEREHVRRHS
jgi:hypothetical protein